ncbi:hypothetical protein Acy02nite_67900 [Actinoplanes cyaneus]|uniref:Uncharacterized protein n=1 Tax=Actinoplanes cyaneus TaxID=52696 RepID=A0A919IMZ4_9ACTN|nr:hypothetical protein [Actinoplanes cyaneus]MCW2139154.1 hypothetical protein [Actinoplanes cyaneus]GID68909.1 hypothetical protein Acy02nite_67900 [Actinoplanes cyaneus]
MVTLVVIFSVAIIAAAAGAVIMRRGNSGDPGYRPPAPTGYEGGVARHSGDAGGISGN